jgi:phosphatidylglycerophosphatase A
MLTSTFFGIGLLRPGPGTWASAGTLLLWCAVAHCIPAAAQPYTALGLASLAVALGIPAATLVSSSRGIKDPSFVVIDEVAGQLIALLWIPLSWKSLLLGFILFRGFDIAKPPPIRYLERLPGGTGIMLDDVAAGLCAFAGMHILAHFGLFGI